MSINDLPVEIILQIASGLTSFADRQCFRLACRAFMPLLPPPKRPTRRNSQRLTLLSGPFQLRSFGNAERGYFFERLSRDGVPACTNCLSIQPLSNFPMRQVRINDGMMCESCLVGVLQEAMPKGYKLSVEQRELYKCLKCGVTNVAEYMHMHHDTRVAGDRRLCTPCHKRICVDWRRCKGLTKREMYGEMLD